MPAPNLTSVHGGATSVGGAPIATVVVEQEATRKSKKRRASADGGGDEDGKLAKGKHEYECRFCLMKFEKSQALGGHMNRHRQEREKEQFQHAQQIVSSVAQQQMPRKWSSLSAEMIQSLGPGNNDTVVSTHLSSHLLGGATLQQYVMPPISFGTSYRPTSPASYNPGTQLPPSPGSNCNYYLSSNASSCNIPSNNNNMQNQHSQQLQQRIGSMDGFSNVASNSPRSVSFHHHPIENSSVVIPLQAAGVSSEFLASMVRNSNTPNDNNILQVSSNTSTSLQAPGTYDVIYNSQLANAFYNGGM